MSDRIEESVAAAERAASALLPPGFTAEIDRTSIRSYEPKLGVENMAQKKEFDPAEELLTPSEVARMFRVDAKTVTRWAAAGRLSSIRTLGGHRRFRQLEVEALIRESEGK